MTVSYRENVDAMTRFTDCARRRIHHLERDPEFLIEMPEHVQILKICASHGSAPSAESQVIAESITKARLVVIEQASHLLTLEKPYEVGDAVRAFLVNSIYSPPERVAHH